MWRLMDDEFKVKGTSKDSKIFFDKTRIVKVEEDWFSYLQLMGNWSPLLLMEPMQAQDFADAEERGPCALSLKLQRYFWRALVPTPQG